MGACRVRPTRPGWTGRWFCIPAGPRNFTVQKDPSRGGLFSSGDLDCFCSGREGQCRGRKAAQESMNLAPLCVCHCDVLSSGCGRDQATWMTDDHLHHPPTDLC